MNDINGLNLRPENAGTRLRIVSVFFLAGSFGLLTACGEFVATRMMGEPREVKLEVDNSLQKYGIEVLNAEHLEFEAEFRKYLAENGRHAAAINAAKRSGILVKNNSEREIVGVGLLWTMSGLDAQVLPQSQNHPGVLVGMKPIDPAMIGKTSVINVGATRFFSHSGAGADAGAGVVGGASAKFPVSVTVDGIFFEDGRFVGENKSFYFEQMSGSVKAKRDFLIKINDGLRAGKSSSEIVEAFLAETPERFPEELLLRGRFKNAEQTFELAYAGSLMAQRREIMTMRGLAKKSDEEIVANYRREKIEDFKELRRMPE